MTDNVLISATEMSTVLKDSSRPLRVLDVRWRVDHPDGAADHEEGHIPGAVYIDLERYLSNHSIVGRGRHPLPTGSALEAALQEWGINPGDSIIVYDDWNAAGASRARWVLRAAGIKNVQILDGGWSAWTAQGLPVETGRVSVRPGTMRVEINDLYEGALPVLLQPAVSALSGRGRLLDARAPERYRGEVEPLDPVAGHIPGAINLPFTELLVDGRFKPADELREMLQDRIGALDCEVGAYCGSGVTATVLLVALELAGCPDASLYPGSWSEWSSDAGLPTASSAPSRR